MKIKKQLFFLTFLLFSTFLFPNEKHATEQKNLYGVELCDAVFNKLKTENLSPTTQSLIISGENTFPYNIILNYKINQNSFDSISENNKNLIIQLCMEDFFIAETSIIQLAKFIKENDFSYNISILFTYGDKQIVNKKNMIFGSEVFVNSLFATENSTAVLLNFDSQINKIVSNSDSTISPMWMLKYFYQAFYDNSINKNLPIFYLSQVFKYSFLTESRLLSTFFKNNIQTIQLDFSPETTESNIIENILINFVSDFSDISENQWDQNFLMINFFGSYKWLSETSLVKFIIIIAALTLILIFLYYITHKNIAKKFLFSAKNLWYLPFFYIVSMFFCYFIGNHVFYKIIRVFSLKNQFSYLILFNFTFLFLIFFSFFRYKLIFSKKYYKEKALDLHVAILSFVNLILFSLIDITLFPIFLLEFLVFLLCYRFRTNTSKALYIILSVLIFIPYIYIFLINIDLKNIERILIFNPYFLFCLILISTPILVLLFRSISFGVKKQGHNFEKIRFSFYITALIFIYVSSQIIISKKIDKKDSTKITISNLNKDESYINFNYSSKNVFNDIVRTINIDFDEQPVQCNVSVSSAKNPILYSNNQYISEKSGDAIFLIPYYPPKELTFEYGTKNEESDITITAIFEKSDYNYVMQTKTIHIGTIDE